MSFSIAAGLALAICRIVLLYQFYDPYTGEFSKEAGPFIEILGYGMLIVLLIMFTSYFWLRKEKFERFSASSNQVSVFSSAFCGFIFVFVGICLVIYYAGTIFQASGGWFFKLAQIISFFSLFAAAAQDPDTVEILESSGMGMEFAPFEEGQSIVASQQEQLTAVCAELGITGG